LLDPAAGAAAAGKPHVNARGGGAKAGKGGGVAKRRVSAI